MLKRVLAIALGAGILLGSAAARAQPPEWQVALENDSVRVTLLTLRPGAGTGRHVGLESELGIVLDGELTLETPTGLTTLSTGGVYWVPSLTPHDIRNEGDRTGRLWYILLKRCD